VHTIPWVHLMNQAQGENKLERFKRSWQPVKSSWSVLRSDKELLLFPVILGIVMFIALGVLVLAWLGSGGLDRIDGHGDGFGLLDVFLLYLLYFVVSTVGIFFNAALIAAANVRLDGGDPTLADGFRDRWRPQA
jgi:hypothetical protein